MANFYNIINHVKGWEGGRGSDPDDNALVYGHSGILLKEFEPKSKYANYPIHTVKGVTWGTYVGYKNLLKQKPNPREFVNMTDEMWKDIAKKRFWDPHKLDSLNSQGIAEIIFEANWGGGGLEMNRDVQRKLRDLGYNVAVDGKIGAQTIGALNQAIKKPGAEKMFIEYMTQERLKYLQGLSDWWKYGKGWTNRVLAAQDRAVSFITKNTGTLTGILILGAVSVLAYKSLVNSSN